MPLLARRHAVRGRIMTAHVPLFTGYVFLWGDREQRSIALSSNRIVQTLITPDSTRLARDLRQIDALLASGAAITPESRLMPGDVVEISSGPLSGLDWDDRPNCHGSAIRRHRRFYSAGCFCSAG